jgi:hypothetical protein
VRSKTIGLRKYFLDAPQEAFDRAMTQRRVNATGIDSQDSSNGTEPV